MGAFCLWCVMAASVAAESTRIRFSLPAEAAEQALKKFSLQSGLEVLFATDIAARVTTNAVRGNFAAKEAIDRMLAGTPLVAIQDERTGAMKISRSGNEPGQTTSGAGEGQRAATEKKKLSPEKPQKNMKSMNPIALVGAWLGLVLAPTHLVQAADDRAVMPAEQTGSLTGRVSNQGTGAYLEGARVTLLPSGRSTLTARDGSFSFPRVSPGSYTISVSYAGLDSRTVTGSVAAGGVERQDVALTSGIYVLDALVVPGEREGNARAVTDQRNAANVKNVISSDAFGAILEENIGTFLQRLPGITMGEIEGAPIYVRVRGISPNLNAVTVDGTRQPGGGTRGGLNRQFELDTVPTEFIETIEVTKAPTPDMDADSIGGSVNLKTKSAFDRRGRVFTYRVGGSYTVKEGNLGPTGNFMYSDLYGKDEQLGVMLTGSYDSTERAREQSLINAYEATTDTNRPIFFVPGNDGPDEFTHDRGGMGLRLDYRLAPGFTLFGSAMYSDYADTMHRRQAQFNSGLQQRVAATIDANGVGRTASGQVAHILPGFTGPPGGSTVTETIGQRFRYNHTLRDRTKKTWTFQVGGRKEFESGEFDFNANLATAKGWEQRYTPSIQVNGVGFRYDQTNPKWQSMATWTQISGPDIYDPANWSWSNFSVNRDRQRDDIFGLQANLRKNFNTAAPAYIKTGFRYRKQEPTQFLDRWPYSYTGSNLATFHANGSDTKMNPGLVFVDIPTIVAELESNPENFRENKVTRLTNQLNNDKQASESVGAAYLMGGVQLNRLGILAGLRVEETRVKGAGNVVDLTDEERARRAAWVGPLTEEEQLRRIQAERGNFRRSSGKYRNVFPGFHFRYEATEGLLARASWSTGIGRPNFSTIIPGDSVNHDTERVTANNTALRPQWADNFDLSLEYYYEPAGLISASAFLKEITDFIYTDDMGVIPDGPDNGFGGDYAGYELRTQANGGYARVRGLEVSIQHQFARLPGFWRNFAMFANYTWLESEGDYGNLGQTLTTNQLAGFIPRNASFGFSYINHRWSIRTLTTYRGASLVSQNANPALLRYNKTRMPTDLSISYSFSPRLTIYLNVNNVFDSRQGGTYVFIPVRDRHNEAWQQHIKFGVSGRF